MDFHKIDEKWRAAEQRLDDARREYTETRLKCKSQNFNDRELVARGEALFDTARKELDAAERLFDKLTEAHKAYWQRELDRQLALAREALLPLVRAHRIASKAFGQSGHFASWAHGRLAGELGYEAEATAANDVHDVPLDPPRSHVLELAREEILSN